MDEKLSGQMDALVEKYTELMLGESNPEDKKKVEMWILYTYISKSMPQLARHWNSEFPDGKKEMIAVIQEIKALNDELRKTNTGQQKEPE
ncbi:YusU family protein [Metabacillus sp. GX 13764]|uniref:DUF2573 family protein n=1 Tax=Metabacillus kandeliae TaxID=2900151 RepID=UPI001E532A5A|nr:DUF2573 family protein [Metabacillus kandeliae]MCD7036301.1 YusU family protein [Metabacillus kandeliae]